MEENLIEKMNVFDFRSKLLQEDDIAAISKTRKYKLMKKNELVAKFTLEWDLFQDVTCLEFLIVNEKSLPFYIYQDPSDSSLMRWLEGRFIPKNRRFVEEILSTLGDFSEPKLVKMLDITKALSLTDDYWVLKEGEDCSWERYNLYDNDFSETLSSIAFTGYKGKYKTISSSPEFTTNGMLKKCWRRIENKVFLYKGGTEGAANTGNEPYAEFYASQIAASMGLNSVFYNLEMWKGELCSVCELFTSKEESYVSAYEAFKDAPIRKILLSVSDSMREDLLDMMVFDMIIMNTDRHYGNFGFIRDNHTGRLVRLAPIFDNGMSLMHQAMDTDFKAPGMLKDYFSIRRITFAELKEDQFEIVRALMGPRQKEKVRRLINFKFVKHPKYNWSDLRLKFLENVIQERVRRLL